MVRRRILFLFALLSGVWIAMPVCAQDSLSFGPVRIGEARLDTIAFTNRNLVDLMVTNVTLTDSVFSIFTAPFSGALRTVAPGETRRIPIRFLPKGQKVYDAELSVDADLGVANWHLSGEGVPEVVVINEILADPPSGLEGDANGDQKRNSSEDEFVELLNIGRYAVSIGGWQLSDAHTSPSHRFRFPNDTWIGPGERIVLFGGGNPMGFTGQTFVDDGKIGGGLSNSGDEVLLINPVGPDTLARASYGAEGGKNQSLVRYPEGRGPLVFHADFPGRGDPFSPGKARVVLSDLILDQGDTAIALGDTLAVTAAPVFSDGQSADIGDFLTWVVADSDCVAAIGPGRWVGVQPGQTQLWARAGEVVSRAISLTVRAPEIVQLNAVPSDTVALVGDSVVVSVDGVLSDNAHVALQDEISWTIAPEQVAHIAGTQVIGMAPGKAAVAADYHGVVGRFSIRFLAHGDLNGDGKIDLLDAVRTVYLILETPPAPGALERRSADLDGNGEIDIRDLVKLIGQIFGGPTSGKPVLAQGHGVWWLEKNKLCVQTDVPVQAVYLEYIGKPETLYLSGPAGLWYATKRGSDGIVRGVVAAFTGGAFQRVDLTLDTSVLHLLTVRSVTGAGFEPAMRERGAPEEDRLYRAVPNPFNPYTVIKFYLSVEQDVTLVIYSAQGQEITRLIQRRLPAGSHAIRWDGRNADGTPSASGVYLARLESGDFHATTKLVLLR